MAEIKLKLKKTHKFPLEADVISTDVFAGKSNDEIKALELYLGNEVVQLGEFFDVTGKSGDANELKIIIDGDVSNVKRIGEKMTAGEIEINSDIGMHVGNQMKGGKIIVHGDADDWAGAMLKGGELIIEGNAGHYTGSAYRGFWKGMEDGIIRVKGTIGNESMLWARNSKKANKWPILYCGAAGSFLGIHNHGGTIIVEGDVDRCAGADQAWGTIVIKGSVSRKLPSYKKVGEVKEVELPNGEKIKGKFIEYSGDHSVKKETNGRLYIAA
ncbi:MAG: formylmethanofuran dehydrogenase subunit C [Candidatus Lokiarchaeota archaeon]|nr:formylmethanofuran dehydrogenase subunit C [Candidatus Lokiarchaeota archaeon]MBD3198936.1 formylmethanofuran dehydrogenase subunit C [Candidatus Lokiarchaeota archaeon]